MYTHILFYLQQEWEAWLAPVYKQIHSLSLFTNRADKGKELLWQHVSAIYAEEKTRQLRRTKLSNDHITLTGHSMMNVRLAAKVLSRSVRLVLQKYGADESQETARFILFMDRFLIV